MESSCYRHEDREALYECTSCGMPICEDCMIFGDEDGDIRCPACSLDTAGAVVMEEEERIERERKHGRKAKERAKVSFGLRARALFHPGYLAVFVVLAAAALALSLYLDVGTKPINISREDIGRFKNPALEMVVLASKVLLFQAEHDGRLPAGLADLFPKYIDAHPRVLKTEVDYDYRAGGSQGFVLSCPQPTKYRYRALAITGQGDLVVE